MTGLMWAVKKNHLEAVCELIKGKSWMNAQDVLHRQPLFFAVENKNADIMTALLNANANCWSVDPRVDYKMMVIQHPELVRILTQYRRVT